MGADEEGTLARLREVRRDLIDPSVAAHDGETVKTTGDGLLAVVASAVDAVRCACAVQRANAVALDRHFGAAYGMAARCYSQRKASGWRIDPNGERIEATRLARLALQHGRDVPTALMTAAIVLAYVGGDVDEGAACTDRALALNPIWPGAGSSAAGSRCGRACPRLRSSISRRRCG